MLGGWGSPVSKKGNFQGTFGGEWAENKTGPCSSSESPPGIRKNMWRTGMALLSNNLTMVCWYSKPGCQHKDRHTTVITV